MKHSLLFHGKPKAAGKVRIPMDLAPASWESPETPGWREPEHRIFHKEYRDNAPVGSVFAYGQEDPCAKDGSDCACFQHGGNQCIYFLSRGQLSKRWITEVKALVRVVSTEEKHMPGDETYIEEADWEISYSIRRP